MEVVGFFVRVCKQTLLPNQTITITNPHIHSHILRCANKHIWVLHIYMYIIRELISCFWHKRTHKSRFFGVDSHTHTHRWLQQTTRSDLVRFRSSHQTSSKSATAKTWPSPIYKRSSNPQERSAQPNKIHPTRTRNTLYIFKQALDLQHSKLFDIKQSKDHIYSTIHSRNSTQWPCS